MQNQKGISTLTGIVIIIIAAVVILGGVFAYQYFATQKTNNQPQIQSEEQNQNQQQNTENQETNNVQPEQQNISVKVKYYIVDSLNEDNKTFSIIDTAGNTLKVITIEKTKFVVTVNKNKKNEVNFSYFTINRFYYMTQSDTLEPYPAKYTTGGFDETIKGILLDKNTIQAEEIFWWVQE